MKVLSASVLFTVALLLHSGVGSRGLASAVPPDTRVERIGEETREVFYGPETFTRTSNTPATVTREISLTWHRPPYVLRVVNGTPVAGGVAAGWVTLNGRRLLGPADFSQRFRAAEIPVELAGNSAFLDVQLASGPSASLTVSLEGVAVPVESVELMLDRNRANSALLGASGGTVSTTGSDGTQYDLAIPPGALAGEQTITVTPASKTYGLRPSAVALAAVHFAPDGLTLLRPATVTITPARAISPRSLLAFAFRGLGSSFHYTPFSWSNGALSLPIFHFSGVGAVLDRCLLSTDPKLTPFEQLSQQLGCVMADGGAPTDDEFDQEHRDALRSLVQAYYETQVVPALVAALACARDLNCNDKVGLVYAAAFEVTRLGVLRDYHADYIPVLDELVSEAKVALGEIFDSWYQTADESCLAEPTLEAQAPYINERALVLQVWTRTLGVGVERDILEFCGGLARKPATIEIDPVGNLNIGEVRALVVTPRAVTGQSLNKPDGRPDYGIWYTFHSERQSVAVVNDAGQVRGKGRGTVTITVTANNGTSGTIPVTVVPVAFGGLQVSPTSLTMAPGDVRTLTATAFSESGYSISASEIEWSSVGNEVATVVGGVVTARQAGSAGIIAYLDGVQAITPVEVTERQCTLALVASPADGGTFIGGGGGTGRCDRNASITASPNPGYAFEKWSDGGTNATINVAVTQVNQTLTAYFTVSSPPPDPPGGTSADCNTPGASCPIDPDTGAFLVVGSIRRTWVEHIQVYPNYWAHLCWAEVDAQVLGNSAFLASLTVWPTTDGGTHPSSYSTRTFRDQGQSATRIAGTYVWWFWTTETAEIPPSSVTTVSARVDWHDGSFMSRSFTIGPATCK